MIRSKAESFEYLYCRRECMINREDMLELTRRMTPARTSFVRMAGCYTDSDGEYDGSFNIHFLKLSGSEKARNLAIAKKFRLRNRMRSCGNTVSGNIPGAGQYLADADGAAGMRTEERCAVGNVL